MTTNEMLINNADYFTLVILNCWILQFDVDVKDGKQI